MSDSPDASGTGGPDRRTFVKQSSFAAAALALGRGGVPRHPREQEAALEPTVLRAVSRLVLPSELSDEEREAAVRAFEAWSRSYEPVAELNHGYGTSEIRYGPPDPVPGWAAQLRALDLESGRRFGSGFAALPVDRASAILRRAVEEAEAESSLPRPLDAGHVAIALMAHWFHSPDGIDRCYQVRIEQRACRGLESSADEPEVRS